MAWEANSLLRKYTGYTAISQDCCWDGGDVGVDSIFALTPFHGYGAGHLHLYINTGATNYLAPGSWVAYCDANSNVVRMGLKAWIGHYDDNTGQDYAIFAFDGDVTTNGIAVMEVSTNPPASRLELVTGQAWLNPYNGTVQYATTSGQRPDELLPGGCLPTLVPENDLTGDSGSPYMVPTTDGHLVFTRAKGPCNGPSQQMQNDINKLCQMVYSNNPPTSSCQMREYQGSW